MILKRLCLLLVLIVVMAACGSSEEQEATAIPTPEEIEMVEEVAFVVGDIAEAPGDIIRYLTPTADYMAANLSAYGYTIGRVRVAPDIETMSAWIESGEVHLYFDSVFPIMMVRNQSGGVPILRRWSRGVSEYHTVFFALADSGITEISDLNGRMVGFDTPQSTSGYLMPAAHLVENGLKPAEKVSESQAVADDEVGYLFSYDDKNTFQWVISGKVAAGVTDNVSFADIPEETRSQMVILAETDAVPRQMAMVSPVLEADQVEAIKALLVGLTETEEGQVVLESLRTSQFDEFPDGIDETLAHMQELYDLVEGN